MMTRDELLEAACALAGETAADDPDTKSFGAAVVCRVAGDLRPAENLLRARDGLLPLEKTPVTDEGPIPYHEELTDGPMVYLVAAALADMNGETETAECMRARASAALSMNMPALCGIAGDCYPCWRQ